VRLILAGIIFSTMIAKVHAKDSSVMRELKSGDDAAALKTEMLVKATEARAMAQIDKLLKQKKGTVIEPDLLFRKAELYMRQAKSNRFFELNKSNDKIKDMIPQVGKKASEKAAIHNAIEIYDSIARRYPRYHQMDMVLFNNGFANQGIRNETKAKALFNKLITEHPDSAAIPDAYLSVGEMFFQERKFDKALKYFNDIKKYPDARVYPYGLYKTAWTYYNLRDAKSGLTELETLVDFGEKVQREGLDSRLDLRKEALEDMALFFEDVYPAGKAYSYFRKPAGSFGVAPVLLRLTELYKSHSRYRDLAVVLHDLVDNSPKSIYLPTAYMELANNYETMKDRGLAVKELERFHAICKPDSAWSRAHTANKLEDVSQGFTISAETDCRGVFDDTSLRLASKWHRMWRKQSQFKELSVAAEAAYRLYLDGTKSNEHMMENRFNFAELLFQNQKYREASENYALVAKSDVKDEKLRHDAGYGSLVALEKAVGDKEWSIEDTKLFASHAEVYFKFNPKGKFVTDTKYKIAFIAFTQNRFEDAKKYFGEIGAQKDNMELANRSQDLLMDIYNKEKSYTLLKDYSKSLAAKENKEERKEKLTKIYHESYFAEIQVTEEKGDLDKAISEYLNFTKQNPKSALASRAWWNAIELYYKTGKFFEAATQGHQYVLTYPEDKNAKDMLLRSAQAFEKTGRVQEAGTVLMEVAKRDPKDVRKWELMAANFFAVSESKEPARKLFEKHVRGGKNGIDQEVVSRWYVMEKSLGKQGNLKKVQGLIFSHGIQPLLGQIMLSQLDEEMDAKNYKQAFETSKRILAMNHNDLGYVRSMARYYQGVILEDEFRNQSLKAKPERIAMVLQLKTQRLEKVQTAYESVIKMGNTRVGLMALKRLGESYLHFSQAVRAIEVPEGTTAEDEKAFRAQLEELASPIEDKGIGTLSSGVQQATKAGLTDTIAQELRHALGRAQNSTMPQQNIRVTPPSLVLPTLREVST
jgi:cellulose synthase operon protein C